jgi:hypothetical protein
MHPNRSARPDASCSVRAGGAGGGIGFGDLNGKQADNQQAGSDRLHHQHVLSSSMPRLHSATDP